MKKIVVRMLGGLGNQLFIYAFAEFLKEKYKADEIVMDLREYDHYNIRKFELDDFILSKNVKIMKKEERKVLIDVSRNIFHILLGINRRIFKTDFDYLFRFLSKKGFFYTERNVTDLPKIPMKNIYMYGYFQSASYIKLINQELKKYIKLKNESIHFIEYKNTILNSKHSIAVSIRCGKDYKQLGLMICGQEYYIQGIDLLKKNNTTLFVFTDDYETSKQILGELNNINIKCKYIINSQPSEQLILMSLCDDFVIANSTFSWWGAFLAENPQRKIVMPEFWEKNLETKNTGLLLDNSFIIKNL